MSQALYTSKTGIDAGQTHINVIANNVANINTTAYKTANVTFSTLFSRTLSSGSAATRTGGGTNPRQIGLGTQVASITRDFEPGTFLQTGLDSDVMIQGNGYFVVQDSAGTQYLTRDGHFTLDSEGNLTNSVGYKLVGTTDGYTNKSTDYTVKVPSKLSIDVFGTPKDDIADSTVGDLNSVSIGKGTVILNIGGTTQTRAGANFTANGNNYNYDDGAGTTVTYTLLDNANLASGDSNAIRSIWSELDMTEKYYKGSDGTYIKGDIPTNSDVVVRNVQRTISYNVTEGDLNSTLQDLVTSMNAEFQKQLNAMGYKGAVELSVVDGGLQLTNSTGVSLKAADKGQTSNFLEQTDLDDALENAVDGQTAFLSGTMNKSADVAAGGSFSSSAKRKDWSISENGVLSATYDDGSTLTVTSDDNGRILWELTTADNTVITGNGGENSDINMTASGMDPANMILEMATVINDAGLISQAGNLWTIGPNAGEAYYGMSGTHGFSTLKSGGLEGSNVDMATELSNMIMAQRAIQANSRVFNTASSVLESITYLGQ